MLVYFKKQAQIKVQSGIKVRTLLFDKSLMMVLAEYSNYDNVFSIKNIVKLPENTGINKLIIKLEEKKLPSFSLIYSLKSIKLKILKIFIKINLANIFI